MSQRIGITASEMLTMRESGMSNRDIAKSLDISYATVVNYIGKQGRRMEGLAAFKDAPPKKEEAKEEVKPVIPKYEPKIASESFDLKCGTVKLSYDKRCVIIKTKKRLCESASLSAVTFDPVIEFDDVPDLVQFLAWAMRERMEVKADAEDQLQAEGCEV